MAAFTLLIKVSKLSYEQIHLVWTSLARYYNLQGRPSSNAALRKSKIREVPGSSHSGNSTSQHNALSRITNFCRMYRQVAPKQHVFHQEKIRRKKRFHIIKEQKKNFFKSYIFSN